MASPPTITETAKQPLSSEELAGDRADYGQTTDPLDKPAHGHDSRPASEDDLAEAGDIEDELEDGEEEAVDTALTRLPPG